MTPQVQLKNRLENIGIPYRRVEVYGQQIVVTCMAAETALRWASLIAQIAKVRGTIKTIEDAPTSRKARLHNYVDVYRVYARV